MAKVIHDYGHDYNFMADSFKDFPTSRYYDEDIIKSLPSYPDWILDVGCGDGSLAIKIASTGKGRVLGIDPSDSMLELANCNLETNSNCQEFVKFKKGNVENLNSLENLPEKFDAIIANRVLHHCEDMYQAVKTLSEKLAPGGRLIILDLNQTGTNYKKTLTSKIINFFYRTSIIFKSIFKFQLKKAIKDLKKEKNVYSSDGWQNHLNSEPQYHWTKIRKAMLASGLVILKEKRRNVRFILLVGQIPDNPNDRWEWLYSNYILRFLYSKWPFNLLVSKCYFAEFFLYKISYLFYRYIRVLLLVFLWFILGFVIGSPQKPLQDLSKSIDNFFEPLSFFLNSFILNFSYLIKKLSDQWKIFLVGVTLSGIITKKYLYTKWRRGPAEDKPNLISALLAWILNILKVDSTITSDNFWVYYRGNTNCRVLNGMPECKEYLKKHFSSVDGHIWIYHSDLKGLIDEDAFDTLYNDVIDREHHIQEVRIILNMGLFDSLTNSQLGKLFFHLSKMDRRSIIRYREMNFEKENETSDIDSVYYNLGPLEKKNFMAYTSDETFIFYTQGIEIPNRQTVCVNRCTSEPGRDDAKPLRVVLSAMRNWPDRRRGVFPDKEPLEKYMNVDLQRIFQNLFIKGNWNNILYDTVKEKIDATTTSLADAG